MVAFELCLLSLAQGQNSFPVIDYQSQDNKRSQKQERKEVIARWSESILLAYPASETGMQMWTTYLHYIRESLWNLNFDTSDIVDEEYWNWFLSRLLTYFIVCCDDLPNRECESYNNNLLRKNFLDYHNGKSNDKPCTWEDVRNALEDGEVAVELSALLDEFLVLKKGFQKPISIPIDSILCDRILNADVHKYSDIYQLYSSTGALHDLWMLLVGRCFNSVFLSFQLFHTIQLFRYPYQQQSKRIRQIPVKIPPIDRRYQKTQGIRRSI